jgi:transketolase
MKAQRDILIEFLFERAKTDPDIFFISVDMGAPALDQWREELPNQFVAAGISEQNAVNFAAGLAAAGKKPFVYMMACWTARCFEQIRYSCAMPGNPVTIIGNGVGLGYAPAGPAHEPTEDLCYMRAIEGLEIDSPSNVSQLLHIAKELVSKPRLRYVRLERSMSERVGGRISKPEVSGIELVEEFPGSPKNELVIASSGYLLERALDIGQEVNKNSGWSVRVIDVWKSKPIDRLSLSKMLVNTCLLFTLEEQARDGAFGAAVLEALSDMRLLIPVQRFSLDTAFAFENGSRDQLLDRYGLSKDHLTSQILKSIKGWEDSK